MKNTLQKLTKLKFLTLALLLILFTCDKDEENQLETRQSQKVSVISFDDFNSSVNQNEAYGRMSNYFDVNKVNNTSARIDSDSNFVIFTDEITLVQLGDKNFYTFKVLTETEDNNFYNLVVETDLQNNIISSVFYEYQPSEEWLLDTSQPFTGHMSSFVNDFLDVNDLFASRSSGQCVGEIYGYWECNWGQDHAPGEGTQCTEWTYYLTIDYVPCSGGASTTSDSGTGVPITVGNIGPGGDATGVGTVPKRPCDTSTGFGGSDGCTQTVNDILINNAVSIIEQPLFAETAASYRERLSAVGEYFTLASHPDFAGLDEMLTDAINDPGLSIDDLGIMWLKTKEAYDILKPYAIQLAGLDSLDDMSVVVPPLALATAERNLTEVAFLPNVKTLLAHWPISIAQWEALGSILFQPQFLLEIGLGFIPGSSIIDVVSGIDQGDYLAVTFGIAGLVVDAFGGTIVKAIGKIGKAAYKAFKIFKIALKYLDEVKNSISLGFKTILDGDTIKILDSADNHIGYILSTVLRFKYTGFGGDIITTPNKTTTVIGKYIDNVNGGGTKDVIESGLSKSGRNDGGLNALSEPVNPNWTDQQIWDNVNAPWVDDAIANSDIIKVISNPLNKTNILGTNVNQALFPDSAFTSSQSLSNLLLNLNPTQVSQLSFFGREVRHLFQNGYTYNLATNQFIL